MYFLQTFIIALWMISTTDTFLKDLAALPKWFVIYKPTDYYLFIAVVPSFGKWSYVTVRSFCCLHVHRENLWKNFHGIHDVAKFFFFWKNCNLSFLNTNQKNFISWFQLEHFDDQTNFNRTKLFCVKSKLDRWLLKIF